MIYIGIDPGKQGAIACINGRNLYVENTPLIKNDYNIFEMNQILTLCISTYRAFAVIERAQAMPGQGVVSMFEFGKGYGIWLTLLEMHKIPYQIVHPRVWTKIMLEGAPGKKERAIYMAHRLFPSWNPKKRREYAQADAILLAEYARRLYQKT